MSKVIVVVNKVDDYTIHNNERRFTVLSLRSLPQD
jgi:hypothetical protein